jgi:hypothetical protein
MVDVPQSITPDSSPNPSPSSLLLKDTRVFIKYNIALKLINDRADREEVDRK